MPQISILESPEYHNTGTYNKNGAAMRYLVEQILLLAPEFELAEVTTNTDAKYDAKLRLAGSRVGLWVVNAGVGITLRIVYWNDAGVASQIGAAESHSYFLGNYSSTGTPSDSWYPRLKVAAVGVSNALKYIYFCSSYNSDSCLMVPIGAFTALGSDALVRCIGTISQPSITYPSLPTVPVGTTLPIYTDDKNADGFIQLSFTSMTDRAGFANAGYTHALLPAAYYVPENGYMSIKWGGLYDLYVLYNANGVVGTAVGEKVLVDGVEVLCAGRVAIFA